MWRVDTNTILTALVVLALGASLPMAAAGATTDDVDESGASTATPDDAEAADTIFVTDDGDAVLVYESAGDGNATGEYGLDTAEKLVYAFIDSENAVDDEAVEAGLVVDLEPDQFQGDGFVSSPAPNDIETLETSISGEQTATTAEFEANVFAEVVLDEETTEDVTNGMAESGDGVSSTGSITATTNRFETDGTASVTGDGVEDDALFELEFHGQNGDYTTAVVRDEVIPEKQVEAWDTESNATDTLENQFEPIGEELGAVTTVSIEEYDFDTETNRLDIRYTVHVEGVEQDALATLLQETEEEDEVPELGDEEAKALADALLSVEFSAVDSTVDVDAGEDTVDSTWNVEIQNLEPLVETGFDIAEANLEEDDEEAQEMLQEARDRFATASETTYTHLVDWSVSVDETEEKTAVIDADVTYDTQNRGDYIDALGADPTDVTYAFTADTEDDGQVNVTGSVAVEDESLLDDVLEGAIAAARDDNDGDSELVELFEAVRAADLETATLDVSVLEGDATLEAGGKFDNMSEFNDVVGEQFGDETVTHLYGEFDTTDEETHVYVENLIEEGATEDDVRATAVADEDTVVNMPDEWDEDDQTFPRLDLDVVADFLGVELEDDEFLDEDGAGFGLVIAGATLLAVAMLARRRSS